MQYNIEWLENKTTSTGKKLIKATLVNGSDKHENVTIWDGFPNFEGLRPGATVEGDIVEKQNGQYTNKTLFAPKGAVPRSGAAQASKLMEKKTEAIGKAMDRKEQGIMLSGAMRDAVQIVTTLYREQISAMTDPILKDKTVQGKILAWRNWILDNHGDMKDIVDPTK